MKSFMKFVVTLLVVAVVGYIAYYLVINTEHNDENLSGDLVQNDVVEKVSGEDDNEELHFPSKSGEGSIEDEVVENISGEIKGVSNSKEDIIKRIDEKVKEINSGEVLNSISENLKAELLNDSAREFMTYFKVDELSAKINIKEGCVEIIPDSDFVENMVYYYDENGKLILYESVSNTVGGSTRYYFENGASIDVVWDYDEKVEEQEEYVFAVLGRAQGIYDRYLGK